MSSSSKSIDKKETNLEPAFFARSLLKIKHSKFLPCINKQYEETPTHEYAQSQGIEWTDSMMMTRELRDAIWQDKEFKKTAISRVEERLHNPLDSLVICDSEKVGKGVFLAPDAKSLPPGTVIHVYASEIEDRTPQNILEINSYLENYGVRYHLNVEKMNML